MAGEPQQLQIGGHRRAAVLEQRPVRLPALEKVQIYISLPLLLIFFSTLILLYSTYKVMNRNQRLIRSKSNYIVMKLTSGKAGKPEGGGESEDEGEKGKDGSGLKVPPLKIVLNGGGNNSGGRDEDKKNKTSYNVVNANSEDGESSEGGGKVRILFFSWS